MQTQVVTSRANGRLSSTNLCHTPPSHTSLLASGRPSPFLASTTTLERPKRPVPGPLDLSSWHGSRPAAPLSALAGARVINDLRVVPYPDNIKAPNPESSIAVMPGRFRYDREFLMQFMGVCKEKPDSLPPLGAIGLEPGEGGANYSAGARGGERRRVGSMGMSAAPSLSRQASMGLGLGPSLIKGGGFAMGQFQSPASGANSRSDFDAAVNDRGEFQFTGANARGGSRRGRPHNSFAPPRSRPGDLSQFGKISKPGGIQFGPSSVFSKKDPNRGVAMSRSGVNIFAALGGGANVSVPTPAKRTMNSRGASADLGLDGIDVVGDANSALKGLNLSSRSRLTKIEYMGKEPGRASEAWSEARARTKVEEDVNECLAMVNIDEAIMALEALPTNYRYLFIDKLVSIVLDGDAKIVVLAEEFIVAARERSVITREDFEWGLLPTIEFADDISVDVPKTYEWLARFIVAAGFDKSKVEELAGKIVVKGNPGIQPRDRLLKEYEKALSA